jgi:serine/threonine protein kinase/Tfp pilus assembly protein PilF
MSKARWDTLSPYVDQALEMDPGQRTVWIANLRDQDPTLASDLEALLEEGALAAREGFLEGEASTLAPPRPASAAGQTVGAYTLVAPIGEGGMGTVWRARRSDGRFEGIAAVKLLNAGLVGRSAEERFKREGAILARLTHPTIAHLLDAGVSPAGQPFLVLEHVEGTHIDQHCDDRRLGVEARLRLFLQVLEAVALAHANLIVHRDLKPANVLVSSDGRVKLLDFGIAKLIEAEAGTPAATALTREGGRALTPEYAAPEQVTGGVITTATDVYALGVLLYVLLSGRHPAGDARRSPADLVRAIVETEPPRLSEAAGAESAAAGDAAASAAGGRGTTRDDLRRTLKGDLETIVAKALKKRPQERYASVMALAEDIRRYLRHEPISARPDTLAYRAAKFVRRNRAGLAVTAAMILLLGGLVGFHAARLRAERDRAQRAADKAAKVSELLTDLLTGADPYGNRPPKEPTVRGILDAGARRLEKELADQPELRAEMLTVIGRTYYRMGAYDTARPLLEEALAAARRAHGPEHEQVAESLNELGLLLDTKGDSAAAAPLLEQALAIRRRRLGTDHKDVAVTLAELGNIYASQGLHDRAEPLLREALEIRRRVLGAEHREVAVSLSDLGLFARDRAHTAEAEALFRESLAISRKALGDTHPNVASSLNNLGIVLLDKGEYLEAEPLFREAVAINRQTVGDDHAALGPNLHNLAAALREQKRFAEAASVIEESIRITRAALGDDHPRVAFFTLSLARIHLEGGRPQQAESLTRPVLEARRRALPEGDSRIALAESLLGGALSALGRHAEAEPLLLHAHDVLKGTPGQVGRREAKTTAARLVALYDAWGRPEKAGPFKND